MRILITVLLATACSKQVQLSKIDGKEHQRTQRTITVTKVLLSNYAVHNGGQYPSTNLGLMAIPGVLSESYIDAWDQPLLYVAPAINCDAPYELISGGYDRKVGGKGDISSCMLSEEFSKQL